MLLYHFCSNTCLPFTLHCILLQVDSNLHFKVRTSVSSAIYKLNQPGQLILKELHNCSPLSFRHTFQYFPTEKAQSCRHLCICNTYAVLRSFLCSLQYGQGTRVNHHSSLHCLASHSIPTLELRGTTITFILITQMSTDDEQYILPGYTEQR